MEKEFIGKEIKDGAFILDESQYNRLKYRSALALPLPYAEKHREIQKLLKEIEVLKNEIIEYVRKDFKAANMPTGMVCTTVDITKDSVYAEWENDRMSIVRVARQAAPTPPAPELVVCPYRELSRRDDFKQILSSGILTKEERRKCLGLPAATTQQPKDAE